MMRMIWPARESCSSELPLHLGASNLSQIVDLAWARKSEGYDMTPERPEGWFKDEEGAFYLETVKRYPGGVLVELGVWLGRSLSYVLPACRELNVTVYAVDPWKICSVDLFKANLARMDATDQVRILQMGSIEAAQQFADESVDVVMLDTTHVYEDTKQELRAWWPKIKTGGFPHRPRLRPNLRSQKSRR